MPWSDTARLVDCSHWQPYRDMDWAAAVRAGLVGAIVKYSQGASGVDPAAAGHIMGAYNAGVPLHGGYHFGDGSDPEKQAAHFLELARQHWGDDLSGVMLMLDAERNTPQMSVRQAEIFVTAIKDTTGRYPWLYMGPDGPDGTGKGLPSGILSGCPLLLPKYGPPPAQANLPKGFTFPQDGADRGLRTGVLRAVQFTDGTTNGGPFPGLGKVDQSKLIGVASLEELRAVWAS